MRTLLILLMIIAGILFVGSVLLMSPKGGLGMGVAGIGGGGGEYGSKKSVESTLKNIAMISSVVFILTVLVLPYTSQ